MKEVIKERQGLYRQEFEHDNCGIGAVAVSYTHLTLPTTPYV